METQLMLATIILRYDVQLDSEHLYSTEGFAHKTTQLMVKLTQKL
jgi:hypothetical protein